MKHWKRKPYFMLFTITALLVLLAILATLQYRWIGQVSQGEQERLQESLLLDAKQFGRDFDREIMRACLSLGMDERTFRERSWKTYAQTYEKWMQLAPYPRIAKDIFLVDADDPGHPRLTRFDAGKPEFAPANWPEGFTELAQQMEQEYRAGSANGTSPPWIYERVPSIIIPISTVQVLGSGGRKIEVTEASLLPLGYIIVTLDVSFIKQEFLPALTARHFNDKDKFGYALTVSSNANHENVIYQSSTPRDTQQISPADATASILSLHLDEIVTYFPDGNPLGVQNNPSTSRVVVKISNGSQRGKVPEATRLTDSGGVWQLSIRPQAGSLQVMVTNTRRRNLVISFGILLLLITSVAFIIISAQRAHTLAQQQMYFVSAVSHELRTPLAVIYSLSENLADGVVTSPPKTKQYGATIKKESRRLKEMVEQILEFAAVQANAKTYNVSQLDVEAIIEKALASASLIIQESGAQIGREIPPDLPPISGDAAAMERALQNLISNAIKYGGENRKVRLKAELDSEKDEVKMTVEDQGMGIASDDLPHVFEPFYRGREAIAAQISGNGLGLSLVKRIVEAQRGRVTVKSAPGRGSSFTIHMPVASHVIDRT
jgi:signal transduction histidine kinase